MASSAVLGASGFDGKLTHRMARNFSLSPDRRSTQALEAGREQPNGDEDTSALLPGASGQSHKKIAARRDSHDHLIKKGPLVAWLDVLDPRLKFATLVGFVMFFFGLHNILQEKLLHLPDFNFGWSLSLLEAIGVLAGSCLERMHEGERKPRVAPFRNYLLLAGLLGMSSSLSNIALHYINYPTKVIFRSCKLIPTMVIAVVWRKKLVSRWEFMAAGAVCAGLIIFAKANAKLEPDFNPVGIGMVVLSVCADAFIPNLQEHVFAMGASRVEATFFTNSLAVMGMLVSTTVNSRLFDFLDYARSHRESLLYMAAYIIMSHVAIAAHMMVVKEYGGVTAVLVGSTRKAMSIALSFLFFPKPFSYHFVLGGGLVLGGLAVNAVIKDRRRKAADRQAREQQAPAEAVSTMTTTEENTESDRSYSPSKSRIVRPKFSETPPSFVHVSSEESDERAEDSSVSQGGVMADHRARSNSTDTVTTIMSTSDRNDSIYFEASAEERV